MGRKAKRGANKVGRDGEVVAPADCAPSSDGLGGRVGTRLPMANIERLMRQVIPKNVKISSHAKHLTQDCAVEFVGFVTGEASEQAKAEHRRTIAPEDFTSSFQKLGFDNYVEPMTTYIRRYRGNHYPGDGDYTLRPHYPVAAAAVPAPDAE